MLHRALPVAAQPALPVLGVPVGSKLLLSRKIMKGDRSVRKVTYGIFRTPDEFVKEAMKVRHPFDASGIGRFQYSGDGQYPVIRGRSCEDLSKAKGLNTTG